MLNKCTRFERQNTRYFRKKRFFFVIRDKSSKVDNSGTELATFIIYTSVDV